SRFSRGHPRKPTEAAREHPSAEALTSVFFAHERGDQLDEPFRLILGDERARVFDALETRVRERIPELLGISPREPVLVLRRPDDQYWRAEPAETVRRRKRVLR